MDKELVVTKSGLELVADASLNKGTAFSEEERSLFELEGLLPSAVSTIEKQYQRRLLVFNRLEDPLLRYEYLMDLASRNMILYFYFISRNIEEILPVIYTPGVAIAAIEYSNLFIRTNGLYVGLNNDLERLCLGRNFNDIKVIVITDGGRVLGIGDQGVGGMAISTGKLSLYSACGQINPRLTLPIIIDVGTNNIRLQNDPLYLGRRAPRPTKEEYIKFMDQLIEQLKGECPNMLLQFEDFSKDHAAFFLERYRKKICCFNDDIQGTAAVALATTLAACLAKGTNINEEIICFYGAGTAAIGIANLMVTYMMHELKMKKEEAQNRIIMIDRGGLVNRDDFEYSRRGSKRIGLVEAIEEYKVTTLIGVSTQHNAFNNRVVKALCKVSQNPTILPLSNPDTKSEGNPKDLLKYSKGKALIATGSPFPRIFRRGKGFKKESFTISQCNNAYIFPAFGLAHVAMQFTEVTEEMFIVAAKALSRESPIYKDKSSTYLLPMIKDIKSVIKVIAIEISKYALQNNLCKNRIKSVEQQVEKSMWDPQYVKYVKGTTQ